MTSWIELVKMILPAATEIPGRGYGGGTRVLQDDVPDI